MNILDFLDNSIINLVVTHKNSPTWLPWIKTLKKVYSSLYLKIDQKMEDLGLFSRVLKLPWLYQSQHRTARFKVVIGRQDPKVSKKRPTPFYMQPEKYFINHIITNFRAPAPVDAS